MFDRSIAFYDRLYAWKDYAAEVRLLLEVISRRLAPGRLRLLDVACGTGKHLALLREHAAAAGWDVEGLDVSEEMLALARARCPDVPFHRGDMTSFSIGRTFDVVTCLFSSIGYAPSFDALRSAFRSFAGHLLAGGIALVEPWFPLEAIEAGRVHLLTVDEPACKVCRMATTVLEGRRTLLDMHYLVGTPDGTEHFVERHVLTCFTDAEYRAAMEEAGLAVEREPAFGRGLWVGRKS